MLSWWSFQCPPAVCIPESALPYTSSGRPRMLAPRTAAHVTHRHHRHVYSVTWAPSERHDDDDERRRVMSEDVPEAKKEATDDPEEKKKATDDPEEKEETRAALDHDDPDDSEEKKELDPSDPDDSDPSTWFPKGDHPDGLVDAEWQADILDGIGSMNGEGSPLFARGWRNSGGKAASTSLFDWWLLGYENNGTMLFFDPEAAEGFMYMVHVTVKERSIKRKEEVTIVAVLNFWHEFYSSSDVEHAAGLKKLIAITENTSVEAEEGEAELPSARQRIAKAHADERAEMEQRRKEREEQRAKLDETFKNMSSGLERVARQKERMCGSFPPFPPTFVQKY